MQAGLCFSLCLPPPLYYQQPPAAPCQSPSPCTPQPRSAARQVAPAPRAQQLLGNPQASSSATSQSKQRGNEHFAPSDPLAAASSSWDIPPGKPTAGQVVLQAPNMFVGLVGLRAGCGPQPLSKETAVSSQTGETHGDSKANFACIPALPCGSFIAGIKQRINK